MTRLLLLPLLLVACTPEAAEPASDAMHARHDPAHHASAYASETGRSIKALSASDLEGYRSGSGMGLARAAELNGYPGPLHVLELQDSLALSADQQAETIRLRETMLEEARALGATLIAQEEALDALFASGQATTDTVDSLTARIAETEGRLRAAHLRTHVAMRALLTPEQTASYNRMRGYDQ